MSGAITEFIKTLVGSISTMATALGSGVNEYVSSLLVGTDGLSNFGYFIALAGAIALGAGVTSKVFTLITHKI
jgi:hypothetical protein